MLIDGRKLAMILHLSSCFLFVAPLMPILCFFLGKEGNRVITVVATPRQGERPQEISYMDTKVIGNGSFGVVYQAKLCDTNEVVAIKKVLQDRRFKVGMLFRLC